MRRSILLTGSTDGIGLEAAKLFVAARHRVLLHGRNPTKLAEVKRLLLELNPDAELITFVADLADLTDVSKLAESVHENVDRLDVLINNAGVFKTSNKITASGLDVRFVVNTIAPYLLTKMLLPLLSVDSRIVNLSSAAQAPVNHEALLGDVRVDDGQAYAQSKLAITMWSRHLSATVGPSGPVVIALNPGSLLATNMVKEGYGIAGNDTGIGANAIADAALDDSFAEANGRYYDNDSRRFANPHPDAMDTHKNHEIVRAIESILNT